MFDDLICMDKYGNTVRSLVQWDLDQTLFIYDTNFPIAPKFQYSNTNSSEALTVQSEYVSGVLQCVVPNQLMVEPYPITCYLYIPESEKGGTVVGMFKIPVRPRPKPSEFEYEDNVDIINIEKLRDITIEAKNAAEMAADDAESSANASASSASASAASAGNAAQSATNAASSASAASQSVTDAAHQVELAEAASAAASGSASDAADSAEDSEAWAVGQRGGVDVPSTDPAYHNNAKYWKDQAQAIASSSLSGLSDVSIVNPQNGQALVYDSSNQEWVNGDVPTTDISGKADKVNGATNGNFAALDASGNLADSGKKASDFMLDETVGVAKGGTGATTLASGAALIGNGTGAVNTRAITDNTSKSTMPIANTNLLTMNTFVYGTAYYLNRSTNVDSPDTNLDTTMARGIYATTTDLIAGSTALTTGTIAIVYE